MTVSEIFNTLFMTQMTDYENENDPFYGPKIDDFELRVGLWSDYVWTMLVTLTLFLN